MIFYFDEDPKTVQFDPSGIDTFGEVPCVFAVVQPAAGGKFFKTGFLTKKNLYDHTPRSPSFLQAFEETKNLVLTRVHNGLVITIFCPPMNRLWLVPRRDTLNNLVQKWMRLTIEEKYKRVTARPDGSQAPVQNFVVKKAMSKGIGPSARGPKSVATKDLSNLKKKVSKKGLSDGTQKEMRKMWDKLDQDKSGSLDGAEAHLFFENVYDWLSKDKPQKNETEEQRQAKLLKKKSTVVGWLSAFDTDGDGTISWQEFMAGLTRLLSEDSPTGLVKP